jgi:hypothetical protein
VANVASRQWDAATALMKASICRKMAMPAMTTYRRRPQVLGLTNGLVHGSMLGVPMSPMDPPLKPTSVFKAPVVKHGFGFLPLAFEHGQKFKRIGFALDHVGPELIVFLQLGVLQ